jgi:hypothetical protein
VLLRLLRPYQFSSSSVSPNRACCAVGSVMAAITEPTAQQALFGETEEEEEN